MFNELNEDNFLIFAANNYNNSRCIGVDEFYDDLNRFKYLKKLFRKYEQSEDLKERLILNHLIVLYNVFSIEAANRMVFYKIEKTCWSPLKTFLIYLNYLPENEKVEIPLDKTVIEKLRKI